MAPLAVVARAVAGAVMAMVPFYSIVFLGTEVKITNNA
jgi:hypothetical protein